MTDQPDWTEQARRLVAGLSGVFGGQGPHDPAGEATSGDCRWCPLCQAAAVLRGERPEVTAALADILTTASAALRSFAAQGAGAGVPAEAPEEQRPPSEDADVQRIEIA
jgi:hypothetical protein